MSHHRASLRYSARREVLTHVAPRYQEATSAQKTLLLDQIVELTGYERKYAIRLLNHVPGGAARILRPRQPIYGPVVQEALFLAWRAIHYPCAQRLVPSLPSLIPLLERDGHLSLDEEHRRQLLAMSVRTAERRLEHAASAHAPRILDHEAGNAAQTPDPDPHLCGSRDDHRPGFLEADLVAHCGGNVYGGYLYTLTLTDIATGWTECLPLLNRSPETVLAAIKRVRALLPFPVLGLDTDNGKEFINGVLVAYCQQEQITFTRGRPECSNDNCYVEQKNGAVVRDAVGHDRLVSALACQQLGELYQARRLLVNHFQPSMKCQSKHIEGEQERRVYDEAKTPLQWLVLSGILPEQRTQELCEAAESLDPLRLGKHLEDLQRAVWRCAGHGTGASLVSFSLGACSSTSVSMRASSKPLSHQASPSPAEVRDWSRSMDDPFLGEWEHIHAFVSEYPMASGGEIRAGMATTLPWTLCGLAPEHSSESAPRDPCLPAGHTSRGVCRRGDPGGRIWLVVRAFKGTRSLSSGRRPICGLPNPAPTPSSESEAVWPSRMPSTTEEEAQPDLLPLVPSDDLPSGEGEAGDRAASAGLALPDICKADELLSSRMTIDQAMRAFLQGEHTHTWDPKTREWHQTSLGQLQRYLAWRGMILLNSLTGSEIRGWLTLDDQAALAPDRAGDL